MSGTSILTTAEQALLDKQRNTRIVEGVAITVTSGVLLGAIYSIWERLKGKKKAR